MSDRLYQLIEKDLTEQIMSGRLRYQDRLPSLRSLCASYSVSKGTTLHALQRLEARGLIESRPRSGFYVALKVASEKITETPRKPADVRVNSLLVDIMDHGAAFDICPGAGGENTQGLEALNRALNRAMRKQRGQSHLYYDAPAGLPELREQLALRLQRRGCRLTRDDIAITSGCQNALFLALMATCQPGDVVAVEAPGFYGVLQLLEQLRLKVVEIPSSPVTGVSTEALEEAVKQWPVKACVVSPCFSTPAGAVLPEPSREHLLTLAGKHDFAIIEDDIYADTALGLTPDPLKKDDDSGRVILCSSFSKSLSRDLRIGWVSGGRWHEQILQLKLVTQLASPEGIQRGLSEFLADGSFATHIKRYQGQLRRQRDELVREISNWPQADLHSIPQGGLTLWLELKLSFDTTELYLKAKKNNVFITPGVLFSGEDKFRHHLRLSFAHPWNDARTSALKSIQTLISSAQR